MRKSLVLAVLLVSFAFPPLVFASQPLETETARLLPAGVFKIESTPEFQTSSQGIEIAVPLALEYGVTDYLEFLVEPVLYSYIRPKDGPSASGAGDLEMTLSFLFLHEGAYWPALAMAGEVKFPTASSSLIGTGQYDYTPFLIASKRFGSFDVHANLGYAIIGSPPGISLNNIITYAAAVVYRLNEWIDLVSEVVGNTSSLPSGGGNETPGAGLRQRFVRQQITGGGESVLTPEATGEEVSGLIGARYYIEPNLFLGLGASYDNNNAFLLRPGITWKFSVF